MGYGGLMAWLVRYLATLLKVGTVKAEPVRGVLVLVVLLRRAYMRGRVVVVDDVADVGVVGAEVRLMVLPAETDTRRTAFM